MVASPTSDAGLAPAPSAAPEAGRQVDPLSLQIALGALAGLITTIVWAATGAGFYWPAWVWFGAAITVTVHLLIRFGLSRPSSARHALAIHGACSVALALTLFMIWALTGGGAPFWPGWPMLWLGAAISIHALVVYADRLPGRNREAQLQERVGELTRTRRGALDVQAAELRRIERDLHDGAQARLVALSMLLGRTEERLRDRPEEAELVRRAREEAGAAIGELRDLARGIAPPVLADRGLIAAVEALAGRSAVPVTVDAQLTRRPPPVVETAAYFVVAEALTNVAKHARDASARVLLRDTDDEVVVEIADDGPGGAQPEGGGLTGLRHRVEALDGELTVTSAPGQGTTIRAELPCAR